MNIGIVIFKNDEYTFRLMRFRLNLYFPEGYIVSGKLENTTPDDLPFADSIHVIYDENEYDIEDIRSSMGNSPKIKGYSSVYSSRYGDQRVIDCKEIAETVKGSLAGSSSGFLSFPNSFFPDKDRGRMIMLFPFSYIDEREAFIKEEFAYLTSDKMCLRLDLMSGIRMPRTFYGRSSYGCLTDVLDKAADKTLTSEDILSFVSPDNNGFLTIGKPRRSDDVLEHGPDTAGELLDKASLLLKDDSYPMNILVIVEDLKISDCRKLTKFADEVHFLLPEDLYEEDKSFRDEIGAIEESIAADIPTHIHYTEKREIYDTVGK